MKSIGRRLARKILQTDFESLPTRTAEFIEGDADALGPNSRWIKNLPKLGRPAKLKPRRILAIAQAQVQAIKDGTPKNAYPAELRAEFGSRGNFRSFLSKNRKAIETKFRELLAE
jgi:hypothetical protein